MSRPAEARGAASSAPAFAAPGDVFAALGDETRLGLMRRLCGRGPLSITRLAEGTQVSRQAVTKHLEVLARAGLVRGVRRGRERIWHLEPGGLDEVRAWLDAVSARWDEALERLRRAVEEPEERD